MHIQRFPWLLLIVLAITGCTKDDRNIRTADYIKTSTYVPVNLVIDSSSNLDSTNYQFGRVDGIEVDNQGNIYVLDNASLKIYKFDDSGKYLSSIGSRGRGEGEFMNIQNLLLTEDNGNTHLYVADRATFKVTEFMASGQFANSFLPTTGTIFPRGKMLSMSIGDDLKFVSLYKLYEGAEDKNCLFHVFASDFRKISCSGEFDVLEFSDSYVFDHLTQSDPGYFDIDNRHNIYYTPKLYSGILYKFAYDSVRNNWVYSDRYYGYVENMAPVEEYAEPIHYRFSNNRGSFYGRVINKSVGLYIQHPNIIHFTKILKGGRYLFGAEIYSEHGSLEKYIEIIGLNSPDGGPDSIGDVFTMDKSGYFYIMGIKDERPKVYRFSLNY